LIRIIKHSDAEAYIPVFQGMPLRRKTKWGDIQINAPFCHNPVVQKN